MTFVIPEPDWPSSPERREALVAERGQHYGFQMYTTEGNDACAALMLGVAKVADTHLLMRGAIIERIQQGVADVAKEHPEIHDTEPEWAITDALNAFLSERGFARVDREELFS